MAAKKHAAGAPQANWADSCGELVCFLQKVTKETKVFWGQNRAFSAECLGFNPCPGAVPQASGWIAPLALFEPSFTSLPSV